MEQESIIYGVRTGSNTYHYIGKTGKGHKLSKSALGVMYRNKKVSDVFTENQEVSIVQLRYVNGKWYDDKLEVVVEKYKENHPLRNPQWMLDGKRGYWSDTQGYWIGKTRDAHTLKRLSESKYKCVVEYDTDGNLKKIWDSGREVAITVFGDYKVVRGAGETSLYAVLKSRYVRNRLKFGSYWFWEHELRKQFNCVPKRLNIDKIIENQKLEKIATRKKSKLPTHSLKYSVVQYNKDMTVKATYPNIDDASAKLGLSPSYIKRVIHHKTNSKKYVLKYGEKTLQPVNRKQLKIDYPIHKSATTPTAKTKRIHHLKTCHTVEWYVGGQLFRTFDSVTSAAEHFGVHIAKINKTIYKRPKGRMSQDLRQGERKRIIV